MQEPGLSARILDLIDNFTKKDRRYYGFTTKWLSFLQIKVCSIQINFIDLIIRLSYQTRYELWKLLVFFVLHTPVAIAIQVINT